MTPARASQGLTRAAMQWAMDAGTAPMGICPVPSERPPLPQRLQAIVAAWKRGDGAGR